MTIYTTLNEIREHSPCSDGWSKLLKSLDKILADDEPLALERILDSNGLDDALWALRAVKGQDKALRLFACQCARLVLPIYEEQYPDDNRPRKAIEAAEAFALGQIGKAELAKAYADATRAATDAADAIDVAYAAYNTDVTDVAYAADAATYATLTSSHAAYAAYAAYTADAAYTAAKATTRLEIEKLFRGVCGGSN